MFWYAAIKLAHLSLMRLASLIIDGIDEINLVHTTAEVRM
jgi:hypothetical protein